MTATLPRARSTALPKQGFRPDIQGLRGLAVVLVIADHAGVGPLSGGYVGVDVFLVVSGFVITRSLLGSRASLATFYAARARRILPMATVVLVATVVAASLLLNFVRAKQVVTDAVWSGLFAANVHFAAVDTDYFSRDLPPSPLQHFWSLAVEEQFYLAWPLLLGAVGYGLSRRRRKKNGPARLGRLVGVLLLVLSASLAWSIVDTPRDPAGAYFATATRVWELSMGALIAVVIAIGPSAPSPIGRLVAIGTRIPAARLAIGWAGLSGVVASALLLSPETPFPGSAALLPVLSTAVVIAAGSDGRGAAAVLSVAPLRWTGDRSYSLYLWHWPVLVLAAGYADRDLTGTERVALVGSVVVLSAASYALVESPVRRSARLHRDRSTSMLLWPAAVAVVLLTAAWSGGSLQAEATARTAAADAAPAPAVAASGVGGDSTVAAVEDAVASARTGKPIPADVTPTFDRIRSDYDYSMCYARDGQTWVGLCRYGSPSAKRVLAVVGDSHAMALFPAFEQIGKDHGWAVVPFLKPGCTPVAVTVYLPKVGAYTECDRWRKWALQAITQLQPDRVVAATYPPSSLAGTGGREITQPTEWLPLWRDGVVTTAKQLATSGAKVTILKDAPGLSQDPTNCLLRRKATQDTCAGRVDRLKARQNAASADGAQVAKVGFLDMDQWFCAGGRCPAVIGGRVTYRDTDHVSRTYALRLAEPLARALKLT